MVNCKSCSGKVSGSTLFCCHCGYPAAVARIVPWPRQLWPVVPQQFWKATMMLSLLVALVAAIGIVLHPRIGLPCLFWGYPFALGLTVYMWAYLGSEACRR
jgi:hypothetical protein